MCTNSVMEHAPEQPQQFPKCSRTPSWASLTPISEDNPYQSNSSEDVLARLTLQNAQLLQRVDELEAKLSERIGKLEAGAYAKISQRVDELETGVSVVIRESLSFRRSVELQFVEIKQREDRIADALHGSMRDLWELYSQDIAALRSLRSSKQRSSAASPDDTPSNRETTLPGAPFVARQDIATTPRVPVSTSHSVSEGTIDVRKVLKQLSAKAQETAEQVQKATETISLHGFREPAVSKLPVLLDSVAETADPGMAGSVREVGSAKTKGIVCLSGSSSAPNIKPPLVSPRPHPLVHPIQVTSVLTPRMPF